MNFGARRSSSPELNLVPLIDVLIVLLIFLVLTTTFSREARLKVDLPALDAGSEAAPGEVAVVVDAAGHYRVGGESLPAGELEPGLRRAAGSRADPLIVIDADRRASHQAVLKVLEAASRLGYRHISFAVERLPEP